MNTVKTPLLTSTFTKLPPQYHQCTPNHPRHWGPDGAAGTLCWVTANDGRVFVLLARRSPYVQQGNTWSVPGGAVDQGESPVTAAQRELSEEISGVTPEQLTAVIEAPCEYGCGWSYTTFVVRAALNGSTRYGLPKLSVAPGHSAWETDAVAWIPLAYAAELRLHPGPATA